MNLSDELIEAGAIALYENERGENMHWRPFHEQPAEYIAEWKDDARAVLEAVAPQVASSAWDSCRTLAINGEWIPPVRIQG